MSEYTQAIGGFEILTHPASRRTSNNACRCDVCASVQLNPVSPHLNIYDSMQLRGLDSTDAAAVAARGLRAVAVVVGLVGAASFSRASAGHRAGAEAVPARILSFRARTGCLDPALSRARRPWLALRARKGCGQDLRTRSGEWYGENWGYNFSFIHFLCAHLDLRAFATPKSRAAAPPAKSTQDFPPAALRVVSSPKARWKRP